MSLQNSNNYKQKPKLNNFSTPQSSRLYILLILSAKTVMHHLLPSEHQRVLLITGLRRNYNKNQQKLGGLDFSKVFLMKLMVDATLQNI